MEGQYQLRRTHDNAVIVANLELATTFWQRFKGLQLRRQLRNDQGLLISPCSSLHTCFMRFPIDVTALDFEGTVLACRRDVKPWRVMLCPRATYSIVETANGAIDVKVGEQLRAFAKSRNA